MVTRGVESFLLRMEETVEDVGPAMWVLADDAGPMVIHYSPPLLLLRAKVMAIPEESRCVELFRTSSSSTPRTSFTGHMALRGRM